MAGRAMRLIGLVACALAVASAAGLTAAEATRTVMITLHISIKSKGLAFSGKVTAGNAACVSDRKVTLYRTNSNVLGSVTTGSSGKWKITAQGSAGISLGHFYAKVKQRSEDTAGTMYVCKAAKSATIPIHT